MALLVECMMDDLYCGVAVDWPPHLRWRTRDRGSCLLQKGNSLTTVWSGMLSVLSSRQMERCNLT